MTRVLNTIALPFAIILTGIMTLAAGMTYGKLSNRWGAPANIDAICARIDSVPKKIGDWQFAEEIPVDDEVMKMLDAHTMFQRLYENTKTGERIRMFVVIGPPGPISVHTPEVCFPSSTFTAEGPRTAVSLEAADRGDKFWAVDFAGTDVHATRLRAYYAWTTTGVWKASNNPRWDFAGQSYLVKIQAVTNLPRQEQAGQVDPCRRFLESFAPAYEQHMLDASR